jgi:hypothetical protein
MYKCKVFHSATDDKDEIILLECLCSSLKEISEELGLSYQQVADISSPARKRKNFTKFKFYPNITIERMKKVSV